MLKEKPFFVPAIFLVESSTGVHRYPATWYRDGWVDFPDTVGPNAPHRFLRRLRSRASIGDIRSLRVVVEGKEEVGSPFLESPAAGEAPTRVSVIQDHLDVLPLQDPTPSRRSSIRMG